MSTEDRLAILDLMGRYCNTFDARDAESWTDLFTDDAVWEHVRVGDAEPVRRYESREALQEWISSYFEQASRDGRSTRHFSTGTEVIELTVDTARARTSVATVQSAPGPEPKIVSMGYYDDELRKTRDGWRFVRRTFVNDLPPFT